MVAELRPRYLIGLYFQGGMNETLNFKKLVWNSGIQSFVNSGCVVRSYGSGAWPRTVQLGQEVREVC